MKCISLWQPWATLIAIGAKRIETRGWDTKYRGPIAIHAAKRPVRAAEVEVLLKAGVNPVDAILTAAKGAVPLGAIVAVAHMVRIVPTEVVTLARETGAPLKTLDADAKVEVEFPAGDAEMAFGDYSPGRFAWLLTDIKPLPKPLPWRGAQRLFDVPDEVVEEALKGGGA